MNSGIQLEHACGGDPRLRTTCHVIVKAGDGNLPPRRKRMSSIKLDFAPGVASHTRVWRCVAVGNEEAT